MYMSGIYLLIWLSVRKWTNVFPFRTISLKGDIFANTDMIYLWSANVGWSASGRALGHSYELPISIKLCLNKMSGSREQNLP